MTSAIEPLAHAGTRRILPGFGPTLGLTLFYLSLIVLVPLASLLAESAGLGPAKILTLLASPRVIAAFRVSFGIAAAAALVNGALGLLVAWVLERYEFPGRRLLDEAERVTQAVERAGIDAQFWDGSFAGFAAIIAGSSLYVGYDSAGQHVAAACGVPLISIFAGFPAPRMFDRWRPCGPGATVLRVDNPDAVATLDSVRQAVTL